jgi:hypothetical protein
MDLDICLIFSLIFIYKFFLFYFYKYYIYYLLLITNIINIDKYNNNNKEIIPYKNKEKFIKIYEEKLIKKNKENFGYTFQIMIIPPPPLF